MNHSPALAVLLWLACALVGTCTLGVVALERAADPVHAPRRFAARVALVELAANPLPADTLAFWERSAHDADLRAERVAAAQLSDVSPEHFQVWILAGQEKLSDADWAAIDAFAVRGGGVVLTGMAGVYDSDGNARERLPLRRLFPEHRFVLRADAPDSLGPGRRGPLAAGLAPGEQIRLTRGGPHLASSSGGALVWGADPASGAVLAGLHRGAPVVWIGWAPDWIASQESALQLAGNALRYAAREALIEALDPSEADLPRAIRPALEALREGELRVSAQNDGAHAARGVTLRIYLPVGSARPALQRAGWFAARPLVRYASGHAWMELVVGEIDAGASVQYTLLF